jgi:hypothetical protein
MSKGMRMLALNRTMRNESGRMRNEPDMNRMGYDMEMRDNPNMRGYDRDRRGRFTGEMEMNRTYEYGPRSEHEMRGGYDMEGRFPDHRRQEHGGSMNYSEGMESRWMPPYYEEGNMEQRNPVGFGAHFDSPGKSDASYQRMEEGKANFSGQMEKGGARSKQTPKFNRDMAEEWTKKLENAGIKVHCDDGTDTMRYKIRQAQLAKTPYMLVVGERDMQNGTVSVRTRAGEDKGAVPTDEFIAQALMEIATKKR